MNKETFKEKSKVCAIAECGLPCVVRTIESDGAYLY